jgi:adenosine deaminase
MILSEFVRRMPKAELHVHLEGSIRPKTLLTLAQRNKVTLPATTVEGLQNWYRFTDFPHFLEVYKRISTCIRTPADIELVAREFLEGQAAQNVRYSEVTYTPYTHYTQKGIPFEEQLAALDGARRWGEGTLGVRMKLILDISREVSAEEGVVVAEWAAGGMDKGVVALGLGGYEVGNPPERFAAAFGLAAEAGLAAVVHAGETAGAPSIWGALETLKAVRIGHGVRCLEDPALVEVLREREIPLEVCPTSNLCLGLVSRLADHPLPTLVGEGLRVTINSDDPPLFNTTLTDEYTRIAAAFGYDEQEIERFVMNAVGAVLVEEGERSVLADGFRTALAEMLGSVRG